MVLASVFVVVALLGSTLAHDWGLGNCPRAVPYPKLSVNEFLGLWYVIEQVDTSSSCLTLSYSRVSDTQLKVTKARQLFILDSLNIDHTNAYSGTLDMPDGDNAGMMRVKWPLNFVGKGDYFVIDTDYTSYAAIFECQTVSRMFHRKSAAILSRTQSLDAEVLAKIKGELATYGIDDKDLDAVDHNVCTSRADSDLNINIDEDTFRKIMSGASDGIKNVASTVADGATSLADTVTRQFGAVKEGAESTSAGESVSDNAAIVINPDAEFIK